MIDQILSPPPSCFTIKPVKNAVTVRLDRDRAAGSAHITDGTVTIGVGRDMIYDVAAGVASLASQTAGESPRPGFTLDTTGLPQDEVTLACLGWALSGHRYDFLKSEKAAAPLQLSWPKGADKTRVSAMIEGICLARNLINTPPNLLGPVELEQAARIVAQRGGAKIKVVSGEKLEREFPLVHAVGVSSPRPPRLIDFNWGDPSHPKLTLVGKGVCFDTGGLDLKPGPFMLQMKKDMGGSAHVLGLAHIVMALNLPVRLRVLIPAVENAVSGHAFRPRDVYRSRKGLSVETSDTDAEGRLILADALAFACEDAPDLLIDCATLTGSARAGLGHDIPALFSRDEALTDALKRHGQATGDPVWPLPLWQRYKKELASDIADLNNIGTSPAGAITAALFLEYFVTANTPWIHIDMFAWEQSGKPGRPRGGADTGLRAMLAFIENWAGERAAVSQNRSTNRRARP